MALVLQRDKNQLIQTSVHHRKQNPQGQPLHAGPPLDSPHWKALPRAQETPPSSKPPLTRKEVFSLACTTYKLEITAQAPVNAHHRKLDYRTKVHRVLGAETIVGEVQGKQHHPSYRWMIECCKTVRNRGRITECLCRGRPIICVARRQREDPYSMLWRKWESSWTQLKVCFCVCVCVCVCVCLQLPSNQSFYRQIG